MKQFYLYASGALGLLGLNFALNLMERYLALNFSFTYTNSLKKLMFSKIAAQPFTLAERFSSGRMMAKITYNIGLIRTGLEKWGIVLVKQILLFAGVVVFSVFLDGTFFLITLCTIPFFIGFTLIIQRIIRKYVNILQTKNAQIMEELYDLFRSWSVIKLFRLEEESCDNFSRYIDEDQFFRVRRTLLYAVVSLVIFAISGVIILCLAWCMLTMHLQGKAADSRFLLYIFYTGYLTRIFIQGLRATAYYEAMKIGVITTFRYIPPSLETRFPASGNESFEHGEIRLRNVHFRYTGGKFRIRKASCALPAGSKTLVLGAGSSGKSALLKLIKGVIAPGGGSITIDDIPVHKLSKPSVRESIAYLSPEARFMEGSWLTNLLTRKTAHLPDSEDIKEMISLFYDFNLQHIIHRYRNRLNERISSQRLLSSTETLLILALRSLRFSPRIILLDGFFSSLHPDYQERMKQYISQKLPGATIVYADHRPNSFFNYDQVLNISNGTLQTQK